MVALQDPRDVLDRLARVEADLVGRACRPGGRRAGRRPSPWSGGCGPTASRRSAPRRARRAGGRGRRAGAAARSRTVRDLRRRVEVDDLEQVASVTTRAPCRPSPPPRRSRRRVTVSGGANRSAVGVTALVTSPSASSWRYTALASWSVSSAASSRPLPRTDADAGQAAETGGEAGALLHRQRRGVEAPHLGDHGVDGGGGDRRAAVGAAVVAGLEHRGDVGARPARADRHAVAHRLGQRDDVGRDAVVLEAEPPPGAAEPGLDLVDHQQRRRCVADLADRRQVAGRRRR